MVKTATFEALLEDAVPDGKGGYLFTLEGKTYTLRDVSPHQNTLNSRHVRA